MRRYFEVVKRISRTKNLSALGPLTYLFTSGFVAILGFFRSFIFMERFPSDVLGKITLFATVSALIGMTQIGLINGGYRILAKRDNELQQKTNTVIVSFILLFFAIALSVLIIYNAIYNRRELLFYHYLALLFGFSTLLSNWFINSLIAHQKLLILNRVNIIGVGLSLLVIMIFQSIPEAAYVALLIQPLSVLTLILVIEKEYQPQNFQLDFSHLRYILSYGFIPYLSGIFILMQSQIERWTISTFLSIEVLGNLFLSYLIVSIWNVFPSAVNGIFFPKVVRLYEKGDLKELNKRLIFYFKILIFYSISAALLVIWLLPFAVMKIFPEHYLQLPFVNIVLISLIIKTIVDPIILFFNCIVKLRPIFISDISALVIYILVLLLIYFFSSITVVRILYSFAVYTLIRAIVLLFSFIRCSRSLNPKAI